jgi:hypothetical protein
VGAGTSQRIVLQGQHSDWHHVFLTLWTSRHSGSAPVEDDLLGSRARGSNEG